MSLIHPKMKEQNKENIPYVFFGTPKFAVTILDRLRQEGFPPKLIITAPDKPQGRKLLLTPPPVKIWAEQYGIETIQPENLDEKIIGQLEKTNSDLFVVAAYGKILRKEILQIPKHGTLNAHPSLLPKYRGPSPIESSILSNDRDIGVSLILLDEKMDHGPIVAQKKVRPEIWPPKASLLEERLAIASAELLVENIVPWIRNKIKAKEQEHKQATYTKKIEKEDGLLDLKADAYINLLKIRAYNKWPRAYFFADEKAKKRRVIITEATIKEEKLIPVRVIPEGKPEMNYSEYLRGQK